jgi:hypothetical protein
MDDKIQQQALITMIMGLQVPQMAKELMDKLTNVKSPEQDSVLHKVSPSNLLYTESTRLNAVSISRGSSQK